MSLEFRDVSFGAITGLSITAPPQAIIGLVGEKGSGITEILKLAAGVEVPVGGEVVGPESRRYTGPLEAVSPAPVDLLALDHSLGKYDALVRARTIVSLERLRRAGATILIASHEEALLERLCDEIWWFQDGGKLQVKGHPQETLKRYRAYVAARLEAWGATLKPRLEPVERHGNRAAQIESIELLDRDGASALTWRSGTSVGARVTLRFLEAVAEPVVGVVIRTRTGIEAYGVNSRIDGLQLGPCGVDRILKVVFRFQCELGAGDYTLTAAAQDPDGTVHDWMDDAVGFVVVDERPSSGFVNLHATVSIEV